MNSIAIFLFVEILYFVKNLFARILCHISKFMEKQGKFEYFWWTTWKR